MSFVNIASCLAYKGLAISFLILSVSLLFTINSLPQVFHGFTENRVVHELVKILFKVVLRFLSEFGIHSDVWFHPAFLFKLQHSVHALQFHTHLQIKLQAPEMNDIVLFVLKRQQQLHTV